MAWSSGPRRTSPSPVLTSLNRLWSSRSSVQCTMGEFTAAAEAAAAIEKTPSHKSTGVISAREVQGHQVTERVASTKKAKGYFP